MSGGAPKSELVQFARWLSGELRARRISGNALALKLGVSKSGVSEYARALRRPHLETLRKMSEVLETPLEDLEAMLPGDETPARSPGNSAIARSIIQGWNASGGAGSVRPRTHHLPPTRRALYLLRYRGTRGPAW